MIGNMTENGLGSAIFYCRWCKIYTRKETSIVSRYTNQFKFSKYISGCQNWNIGSIHQWRDVAYCYILTRAGSHSCVNCFGVTEFQKPKYTFIKWLQPMGPLEWQCKYYDPKVFYRVNSLAGNKRFRINANQQIKGNCWTNIYFCQVLKHIQKYIFVNSTWLWSSSNWTSKGSVDKTCLVRCFS